MKILGIDTSTKILSIGIFDSGKIYEYNLEVARGLSGLIASTTERILDTLGWSVGELDYLACGLGPGSFTGLRVGVSFVKGLSWAAHKPVVGISSLDILAEGVKASVNSIVPIIDAKRNLIYCSVYKKSKLGLKKIAPYMLVNEDELAKKIKPGSLLLGDGVSLYGKKISSLVKGASLLEKDYWYPKGHNLISLALERIKNKKLDNAFNLEPLYLYSKECQIKQQVVVGR